MDRLLPLVRERGLDARVAIVGRRPSPDVLSLATVDGVEVTGEVPDVRPWLWRAQAFACSMVSGTGIKNKLLEALVRCSVRGDVARLPGSGRGFRRASLIADSAERFAGGGTVLEHARLRARLGTAGRAFVTDRHGWESTARAYERSYEPALGTAT